LKNSYNGKKIKRVTQIIKNEIYFFTPKIDEEFIYEVDYRGEYELCWIVTKNIKENIEISRMLDKNINTIEWI